MTDTTEPRNEMGPPDPDWPNDYDLGLRDLPDEPPPGTAWCKDGEGAMTTCFFNRFTVSLLDRFSVTDDVTLKHVRRVITRLVAYDSGQTNLDSTGEAFTPQDCERILSARFRVGKD